MKLNDEQRKLIEDNIKLVYYSIKLVNGSVRNIDLIEAGYIGICKAALNYNVEYNNTPFATYATYCIKNEVLNQYRHNNSLNKKMNDNTISLNSFVEIEDGKEIELIECIQDKKDQYKDFETKIYMKQIFDLLDKDEYAKEIIIGYINGKSFKEIAKEKNITYQAVYDKFNKTIKKLRKELI